MGTLVVRKAVACFTLVCVLQRTWATPDSDGAINCPYGRHLQQATDDSDDFGDLAEDVSVFQEAQSVNLFCIPCGVIQVPC